MAEEKTENQEMIYLRKKIAFLEGIVEGLVKNAR